MFGIRSRARRGAPAPEQRCVPYLLGMPLRQAREVAAAEGFPLNIYGEGECVVDQDPMAQMWMAAGAGITVTVDGAGPVPRQRLPQDGS